MAERDVLRAGQMLVLMMVLVLGMSSLAAAQELQPGPTECLGVCWYNEETGESGCTCDPVTTPEPATMILLGGGMAGAFLLKKRPGKAQK